MLHSTTTYGLQSSFSVEESIRLVVKAGFPAVDISLCKDNAFVLADDYRETAAKLRAVAESCGIIINQTHAPFSYYERYTGEIVPNMARYVEFSGLLGAKTVIVHPIQYAVEHYKHSEQLFKENMEFYSSLAPVAKKFGVKVGIENMWQRRPVSNIIDDSACADPAEFIRYYDTLNDPEAFTVCIDIGHIPLCGRDPSYVIRQLGSRIGALHVHDVDFVEDTHTLPGLGKIDWDSVCRALADVGYKGDFTLESHRFVEYYDAALIPAALRFMSEVASHYAALVESYKAN